MIARSRPASSPGRPVVGVSACLLGVPVRWDGTDKRTDPVVALADRFDLVAVCPEDELGMGTPREPIHIDRRRRLVGVRSGTDHTDAMLAWATQRVAELTDLDGYVLKARSPSCGLRVVVQDEGQIGRGVFAQVLTASRPDLPVVEEDGVDEAFVVRVFDHWRSRCPS